MAIPTKSPCSSEACDAIRSIAAWRTRWRGSLPDRLTLAEVPIGDLPHYNGDLEVEPAPASWTAFRDRIRAADAILFVTPEYNRSVPGVLKNAIDVGSRPAGKSVWARSRPRS